MKRWVVYLPLLFLLGAIALFGLFALGRNTQVQPDAMVGKPVPEISAPLLEGGPPVTLASQVQGPALVNLFASWCPPCIIEAPYLETMKERGARIVGIAEKDDPADTARFLTQYGDPFAVILKDPEGRAMIEFGATALPETFVVDSKGVIVAKHAGGVLNEADVQKLMDALAKAQ